MASRSKYVFVTTPELVRWLNDAAKAIDGTVLLFRGSQWPLERWDGREGSVSPVSRVYLAAKEPDFAGIRFDSIAPARLGWLQIDVPRTEGSTLFAIQIAARSDWYDSDAGAVKDNPAALKLFDRLWARWKRHLSFHVVARNTKSGDEASYPAIGYSEGAALWFRQGGELRQQGVGNIEFRIPS